MSEELKDVPAEHPIHTLTEKQAERILERLKAAVAESAGPGTSVDVLMIACVHQLDEHGEPVNSGFTYLRGDDQLPLHGDPSKVMALLTPFLS